MFDDYSFKFKLHNYVVEMKAILNLIIVDGCLLLLYHG